MPVSAQSPIDMELSGEGSDVDMIHGDDAAIDPEEEEDNDDDDDEPEPEEVRLPCKRPSDSSLTVLQDVESDELSPPPSPHKPRLKIKLKLPQILSPNESSSRGTSTPSGGPSHPPSRRGISRGTTREMYLLHDSAVLLQILNQRMRMRTRSWGLPVR